MSFVLNTDAVDEADRAEFVHEALAATVVPIELQWLPRSRGAAALGVITNLGDLTICSGRTSAQAGYTNQSSTAFTLSGVNGGNRCSIATSGGDISIDLA